MANAVQCDNSNLLTGWALRPMLTLQGEESKGLQGFLSGQSNDILKYLQATTNNQPIDFSSPYAGGPSQANKSVKEMTTAERRAHAATRGGGINLLDNELFRKHLAGIKGKMSLKELRQEVKSFYGEELYEQLSKRHANYSKEDFEQDIRDQSSTFFAGNVENHNSFTPFSSDKKLSEADRRLAASTGSINDKPFLDFLQENYDKYATRSKPLLGGSGGGGILKGGLMGAVAGVGALALGLTPVGWGIAAVAGAGALVGSSGLGVVGLLGGNKIDERGMERAIKDYNKGCQKSGNPMIATDKTSWASWWRTGHAFDNDFEAMADKKSSLWFFGHDHVSQRDIRAKIAEEDYVRPEKSVY